MEPQLKTSKMNNKMTLKIIYSIHFLLGQMLGAPPEVTQRHLTNFQENTLTFHKLLESKCLSSSMKRYLPFCITESNAPKGRGEPKRSTWL